MNNRILGIPCGVVVSDAEVKALQADVSSRVYSGQEVSFLELTNPRQAVAFRKSLPTLIYGGPIL